MNPLKNDDPRTMMHRLFNFMKADDFPKSNDDKHDDAAADPALWALLGRARPPVAPSPYFTRRVLREIARREEEKRDGSGGWRAWLTAWLRPRAAVWTTAAVAGAAVAFTAIGLLPSSASRRQIHQFPNPVPTLEAAGAANPTRTVATVDPAEAEGDVSVIAELDDLLDAQKNRVWLEDDTAS
ncbi:MAG: hypothetical protein JO117_10345 [Verrucomicrobia bacterium]|nr:hypothetical protein [Verrucomicrobiota bacterium]